MFDLYGLFQYTHDNPTLPMKDIFQDFKKANTQKHIAIALTAFAFALGVNALIFNTDTGLRLQASAIEYSGIQKKTTSADLVLTTAGADTNIVKLSLGRNATQVSLVEATVFFNPEALDLVNATNEENKNIEVVASSSVNGTSLLIIRFKTPQDVVAGTSLASLTFAKKSDGATPVNLAGTRLVSDGVDFELTSQGVEF